jgi:recombinational DNA repair protein RecR
MRKSIFRFIGTKRELQTRLAQLTGSNVVYLGHCELCGRLCAGDICRSCEPLFRKWTKKAATELAAEKNHPGPSIA